jgi:hypothetical protein
MQATVACFVTLMLIANREVRASKQALSTNAFSTIQRRKTGISSLSRAKARM